MRIYLSFVFMLAGLFLNGQHEIYKGGIIRGDTLQKEIALIFSGDEYGEGLDTIRKVLKDHQVPASFFFTGRFYRNKNFLTGIQALAKDGHYMGAHSDQHLLYCDWIKRDSLLVTQQKFEVDLYDNYKAMKAVGLETKNALYFLPPYEWYNDTISAWAKNIGIQLINFTPGTLSHTDYTTLKDKNYRSNQKIFQSITDLEVKQTKGLRGFILLMHIGAGPDRKEKFYSRLPELILMLKDKGYQFKTISGLLE